MQQQKSANSVYVQGFAPEDIHEDLVFSLFSRCGLIKTDLNNKPKIKLYRDKSNNTAKGDCLVTFVLPESVFLAIQQFDSADYKPGFPLSVSQAEFSTSTATSQPVDEKNMRRKKVKRLHERAKLSWEEESSTAASDPALLIVVLKGMFVPSNEALDDAELERDLIEGLESILTSPEDIKKITVFKSHPEAVIVIRFNDKSTALRCVELMNGRWFDGRKISAELWDGVTEYAAQVDLKQKAAEEEARLARFERELEEVE